MSERPELGEPVGPIEEDLRRLLDEAKSRDAVNPAFDAAAAERGLVRLERTIDAMASAPRRSMWRSGMVLVSACIVATIAGTQLVESSHAPAQPVSGARPSPSMIEVAPPSELAPTPSPAPAPAPTVSTPEPAAAPMLHVDELPKSARRPSPPPPTAPRTAQAGTSLAKDYAGALRAIREHGERFPSGQLNQECESLHIQTLVETGRIVEARERAEAFRVRFPNGLLLPSVASAVASAAPTPPTP
jgi:hypothetical protein